LGDAIAISLPSVGQSATKLRSNSSRCHRVGVLIAPQ
jgi:hypothetical protein